VKKKLSVRVGSKIASDIVNNVMKKLVELSVEGAKILDLCVEGDKLIEEGTGAVYNKPVKGVKVSKGMLSVSTIQTAIILTHCT